MTLALIDGDIVAFRAAAGVGARYDLGDGQTGRESDPAAARESALMTCYAWAKQAGCKDILVTFTGSANFRKTILPSYKAARKGVTKPPDYQATVEAVRAEYPSMLVNGLEADDLMGILATTERFIGEAVVVTMDKDLRTIPGRHLNPFKEREAVDVRLHEADHYWLMQTIMGDPTDGYKGIPGSGPAAAVKALGMAVSGRYADVLWPAVVAAYQKAGLNEDDALVQARVARILRRQDYDKATKEVVLWQPRTLTCIGQRLNLSSL